MLKKTWDNSFLSKGIKIKGIYFKVHPSFLLLMVVCSMLGMAEKMLLVFGMVLLHDTMHIIAAKGYGIKVQGVVLYPYGGAAVMENIFEGRKVEETIISLAGPALNLVLFFLGQGLRMQGILSGNWAIEFVQINLWLAVFNLIPVLPLDGGRIIRAFLSDYFGFVKVSKTLAHMGKILGGAMIIIGFYLQTQFFYLINPYTIIILGFFFWIGSNKELANARIVFLKNLCRKKEQLLSQGLMRSRCLTVKRATVLETIIDELNMDSYSLISVLGSNDKVEKTLSETQIMQGMLEKGWKCAVGEL